MTTDPRVVTSTLADDEPLAFTVAEIGPGLFEYRYFRLARRAHSCEYQHGKEGNIGLSRVPGE